MSVAPSASETPSGETTVRVEPSLEQARMLAQGHNLIPLCHSFIADCETPVSAFLKLRSMDPTQSSFLLESAEQGQRMGRWSFIGFAPHGELRWTIGDGGDPYALAAERVARFDQA